MLTNFDFKLTGTGWAELLLQTEKAAITITASYTTESLPSLLAALLRLRNRESKLEIIVFDAEDAGNFHLLLTEIVDGLLRLEVFENANFDLLEPDIDDRNPMPSFSIYIDTSMLCYMVKKNLTELLETIGIDGYKEKWCRDFPESDFNKLKG